MFVSMYPRFKNQYIFLRCTFILDTLMLVTSAFNLLKKKASRKRPLVDLFEMCIKYLMTVQWQFDKSCTSFWNVCLYYFKIISWMLFWFVSNLTSQIMSNVFNQIFTFYSLCWLLTMKPLCIVNAVTVHQAVLTQCSFLLWVQWAPHGSNARPRPLSLALGDKLGADHRQDERRAGADRHPVHGHSGEGTMESSKSAGFI